MINPCESPKDEDHKTVAPKLNGDTEIRMIIYLQLACLAISVAGARSIGERFLGFIILPMFGLPIWTYFVLLRSQSSGCTIICVFLVQIAIFFAYVIALLPAVQ